MQKSQSSPRNNPKTKLGSGSASANSSSNLSSDYYLFNDDNDFIDDNLNVSTRKIKLGGNKTKSTSDNKSPKTKSTFESPKTKSTSDNKSPKTKSTFESPKTKSSDSKTSDTKLNQSPKSGMTVKPNRGIDIEIFRPSNTTKSVKTTNTVQTDPIITTFEKYYPNKTIKPLQYQIIKSILDKNDTMGILPTGYGKSLCYQLPFLMDQDKILLVVSPLISLMEDQKDKLEKMNIPVACFHSNVGRKQRQDIKNEILENLMEEYDDDQNEKSGMILFLTPEYIIKCENWIKQMAQKNKLCLVAFDEAHCISTWGHDFRPDYQGLYRVKDWLSEARIPILALTATATKQVEDDIKTYLQLTDPKVFKTSFDRPNLIINVKRKPTEFSAMFPILNKYIEDFSIIYCKTREKAEEVCEILKENEYNADVYHAGLSAKSRQEIQDKFANKELNIIVATVAFGMGIDQNIHLVIHWGCPSDMESYYQEIGRAGRDGIESECIMYYDKDDFRVSRYFLKSLKDSNYKRFKDEQISKMERYCLLPQCRRKLILGHFGETIKTMNCAKCDNCIRQQAVNNVAMDNLAYPIYILAKTIFLVKCKLGSSKIILITRGSKSKLINEFSKCQTYGLLKDLVEDQIKSLLSVMLINGLLKEKTITSGFGTVLETTTKLVNFYTKVSREIGSKALTFDNLNPILSNPNNKLHLDIPIEYDHIINIKFKTSIDNMLQEFEDEL
jgi:RecQ family ATP-dependent DNA helicase